MDDIDSSGIEMLEELIDSLAAQGVTLVVARPKGPLQAQLDSAGVTDKIGAVLAGLVLGSAELG